MQKSHQLITRIGDYSDTSLDDCIFPLMCTLHKLCCTQRFVLGYTFVLAFGSIEAVWISFCTVSTKFHSILFSIILHISGPQLQTFLLLPFSTVSMGILAHYWMTITCHHTVTSWDYGNKSCQNCKLSRSWQLIHARIWHGREGRTYTLRPVNRGFFSKSFIWYVGNTPQTFWIM